METAAGNGCRPEKPVGAPIEVHDVGSAEFAKIAELTSGYSGRAISKLMVGGAALATALFTVRGSVHCSVSTALFTVHYYVRCPLVCSLSTGLFGRGLSDLGAGPRVRQGQ